MSTRATIQIRQRVDEAGTQQAVINLYHHSDGYPEGVGADLKRWLKGRNDGYGPDYVMWDCDSIATELVKGCLTSPDEHGNERPDKNYQVTFGHHGDEAYAYVIDCDEMTLKCYDLKPDQFDWSDAPEVEIPDQTWYEVHKSDEGEDSPVIEPQEITDPDEDPTLTEAEKRDTLCRLWDAAWHQAKADPKTYRVIVETNEQDPSAPANMFGRYYMIDFWSEGDTGEGVGRWVIIRSDIAESPYQVHRPNWHTAEGYDDRATQPHCRVSNRNNLVRWALRMIDAGRVTDIYADCY